MYRIVTFFTVFRKSFTSPPYYRDILNAPFSYSLKFFYFYFLLYAIIGTAFLIPGITPLKNSVQFFPSKLEAVYPPDLEIKIAGGEVTTNVQEPYYLPLKNFAKIFSENDAWGVSNSEFENLLVIDTAASAEDFPQYNTIVLLTKRSLVVMDNGSGSYKVTPLLQVPDIIINRLYIQNFMFSLNPYISKIASWLVPFLSLNIFFGLWLVSSAEKVFYLLFFTLIVLFIGKIINYPVVYKKAYQMGLHLVIIPTTISGIFSLLNMPVLFPFFRTILMSVLTYVVLWNLKNDSIVYSGGSAQGKAQLLSQKSNRKKHNSKNR